ncbi:filamentous hemagglutinin N-terminal domain-containing protein [Phormidesmis sp. 146-35]
MLHSFDRFSVPTGGSANFNNAANITYILSRVTGSSLSNIDGLIRANGAANVFLMNPNGIVFGTNAQLNIGGSFVGTTANAIGLANGDRFFANPDQPLPNQLLNVNPNAFLFNQLATQAIVNRSTANNIGLRVPAERSLLLVGGDVRFESGRIVSPGSRVELAGVSGQGTIALTGTGNDLGLSVPDGVVRSDVSLSNSARVDVQSRSGGSITVHTRNLTLANDSRLFTGISQGSGSVGAQTGDIIVNATDTVNLTNNSRIINQVGSNAIGNVGGITITTGVFSLSSNSSLNASTFGRGNAGNILVNATDTVNLTNDSRIVNQVTANAIGNVGSITITTGVFSLSSNSSLSASTFGRGNAGNILINVRETISLNGGDIFNDVSREAIGQGGEVRISTGSLSLTNGAQLSASTLGQGDAGSVMIDARDTIFLYNGRIFSSVQQPLAIGQGGEIHISTGSLFLTNGAALAASTLGRGNAGNIIIDARDTVAVDGRSAHGLPPSSVFSRVSQGAIGQGGEIRISTGSLSLTNGAQLIASTLGQGNSGNVIIDARDAITVDGTSADGQLPSAVFSNVSRRAIGQGGTIRINTGELLVQNGARITVNSQGTGIAGDLEATAQTIRILNRSRLTAETRNTAGGNIRLNVSELLLLRNNSLISTTAGTAQAGGDGGNIRINAPFIVSALTEDNDIRANAFLGRGGNINISTQGIFGIQFAPQSTPRSDITASSQFGVNGIVEITTLDTDPSRGTIELPSGLVDSSRSIVQGCPADRGNSFVVTGQGGLPPTPDQSTEDEAGWRDRRGFAEQTVGQQSSALPHLVLPTILLLKQLVGSNLPMAP